MGVFWVFCQDPRGSSTLVGQDVPPHKPGSVQHHEEGQEADDDYPHSDGLAVPISKQSCNPTFIDAAGGQYIHAKDDGLCPIAEAQA